MFEVHKITLRVLYLLQDSRDSLDDAMKAVIEKSNKEGTGPTIDTSALSVTDLRKSYRQIRSSNLATADTQAVSFTAEADQYKVRQGVVAIVMS